MMTGDPSMPVKSFQLSIHVILRNERNQILLLRRSLTSKINPGKWDLPGGKIDEGENFNEALSREVAEETSLPVNITGVAGVNESDTVVDDFIIVTLIMEGIVGSGTVKLSNEHDDFVWVNPDEILQTDLCSQFHDFLESYL